MFSFRYDLIVIAKDNGMPAKSSEFKLRVRVSRQTIISSSPTPTTVSSTSIKNRISVTGISRGKTPPATHVTKVTYTQEKAQNGLKTTGPNTDMTPTTTPG